MCLHSPTTQQQHVNDARLDVPEDAGRSLCQRRKLTVDFHEIGWGEWIISPKTFEAQYCAGRCPFPLTKVSYSKLLNSFAFPLT